MGVALTAADRQAILLWAVVCGLLAVWGRHSSPAHLHLAWLVPTAFAPEWLAFYLPANCRLIIDDVAAAVLVSPQTLSLIFAWCNRDRQGFWALGIGLGLNLLVIIYNSALMPISPEI